MIRTKKFVCDSCGGIEFEITIEPINKKKELTPDEEMWLADLSFCPSCGMDIQE